MIDIAALGEGFTESTMRTMVFVGNRSFLPASDRRRIATPPNHSMLRCRHEARTAFWVRTSDERASSHVLAMARHETRRAHRDCGVALEGLGGPEAIEKTLVVGIVAVWQRPSSQRRQLDRLLG